MSTLNKAKKSKMEMNVLANEDGTKISSVLGSHSAVERACSVCPQRRVVDVLGEPVHLKAHPGRATAFLNREISFIPRL